MTQSARIRPQNVSLPRDTGEYPSLGPQIQLVDELCDDVRGVVMSDLSMLSSKLTELDVLLRGETRLQSEGLLGVVRSLQTQVAQHSGMLVEHRESLRQLEKSVEKLERVSTEIKATLDADASARASERADAAAFRTDLRKLVVGWAVTTVCSGGLILLGLGLKVFFGG